MSSKVLSLSAVALSACVVAMLMVTSGCGGGNSADAVKNERDAEPTKPKEVATKGDEPVKPKAKPAGAGGGTAYDVSLNKGKIKGVVSFDGKIPKMPAIPVSDESCKEHRAGLKMTDLKEEKMLVSEDNKVANVVVYVSKGFEAFNFDNYNPPAARINQLGCQYTPHVLAVTTNQALEVESSDPVTHNVHIIPSQGSKEENLSQPTKGIHSTKPRFGTAELGIPIKCDVHGWMKAWVCAFDHPFFAVTKPDGTFEIDLPPGDYTLSTWQESVAFNKKLVPPAEIKVTVTADKPVEANFVYKMK